MGLDSYLYRTSKRRVDATKKFGEIRRAYSEDIDLLMKKPRWKNLFDSLPKNEFGNCDWKSYTDEQKKGVRYLRRAARRVAKKHGLALDRDCRPIFDIEDFGLNHKDDSVDEIGYWRKNWQIHQYIIDNFWHDKDNDNLVDVFLTKSDLEKIVADGWGDEFEDALKHWDDDYVVFYHPWY